MVGGGDGVESELGEYSKSVAAISLQCSSCMPWVQRRCSASAGFVSKKCRGETPRSVMAEEGLVVDGEKYGGRGICSSNVYKGSRVVVGMNRSARGGNL